MNSSVSIKEDPLTFCFEQIVHVNSLLNNRLRIFLTVAVLLFLDISFNLKPVLNLQYTGYYAIVCLAVAVLFSVVDVPNKKIKRSSTMYVLLLLSVFYIVSAFIFREGNRIILAGCFGIMIPLAGIALSNKRNYMAFFYAFSIAETITFVLLLISSVIFAPFFDCQYSSILLNPNGLSTMLVSVIIANIWMIEYYLKKNDGRSYVVLCLAIIFAFEITFLILSRSRTGIMAVAIVGVIWLLYRMLYETGVISLLIKVVAIFVLCAIALSFTTGVLSRANIKLIERQYANYGTVRFFSMKYFIESEDIEVFYYMLQNNGHLDDKDALVGVFGRLSKGSKEGEDVSSGRFAIWKCALKASNMTGHAFDDTFYVPERECYTNDTHNMILAVAFQLGWPAAIVMMELLCIDLMNLMRIAAFILKNKKVSFKFFHYSMTTSAFFIVAMFSNTYTPIGSMIGIMFWFMQPIEKLNLEEYGQSF